MNASPRSNPRASVGVPFILGSCASAPKASPRSPATIRETVSFDASPHDIYELLMDSTTHSAFTGQQAIVSREVGGAFRWCDGVAEGTNLALDPDQRIVLRWRHRGWPEGRFSTATFLLRAEAQRTVLDFLQEGVPDGWYEEISNGWKEFYWSKMQAYLKLHGRAG